MGQSTSKIIVGVEQWRALKKSLISVLLRPRKNKCGDMPSIITVLQWSFYVKKKKSAEDISNFQLMIDRAYIVLHSMYKRDVATNYFHMLSSRHISWFMEHVGLLNNYSNQGFEALNRLMKRYLNTRTNKVGGRSKCKSKLRPIANLFFRCLIWLFGVHDAYDAKISYTNGSTLDAEIFD